jgi:inorganic pyrophosphatase
MQLPPAFNEDNKALINAVVETPKGSRNKFAFEKDSGLFLLKKILPAGTAFPLDFGFIPHTLCQDGDPLDVLIIMEEPSYPGCLVPCRPIGIITGKQSKGDGSKSEQNDRIIAVADASIDYAKFRSVKDLSKEHLTDLEHFFMYYNAMAGGSYKLKGTKGPDGAMKAIKKALL